MTQTILILPQIAMLLNTWLTKERHNQAVYYSLAKQLRLAGWLGSEKLFKKSGDEEGEHAEKVMDFMVARGTLPFFDAIPPCLQIGAVGLLPFFQEAYKAECETTILIADVREAALKDGDQLLVEFTDWFMEEQTKSIDDTSTWIGMIQATPTELRVLDGIFGA